MSVRQAMASLDPAPDIEALRNHYRFRDDDEVVEFLTRHPRLTTLLEEAAIHIYEFFPRDTTLALEVFDDPEDEEAPPKLYAVVQSSLPLPDVRSRLYRFRADWWRGASAAFIRKVAFTFD